MHVGYRPCPDANKADIRRVPALSEIDFDPVFLARFDVNALLDDRVELLNHEERMDSVSYTHLDVYKRQGICLQLSLRLGGASRSLTMIRVSPVWGESCDARRSMGCLSS